MCVIKQIRFLCKLFSIYDETPEEFLDKTEVDKCFYLIIFEVSQSLHRKIRVRKGSNKFFFALNLFQFCVLNTAALYPPGGGNYLRKKSFSRSTVFRNFLRTFDKSSKSLDNPYPKPKFEIGSTKSKENLLSHYYNGIIEHPIRQIR